MQPCAALITPLSCILVRFIVELFIGEYFSSTNNFLWKTRIEKELKLTHFHSNWINLNFHFPSSYPFLQIFNRFFISFNTFLNISPINNKPNLILHKSITKTLSIIRKFHSPFFQKEDTKITVQNLTLLEFSYLGSKSNNRGEFYSSRARGRRRRLEFPINRPSCTTPSPLVVPRCLAATNHRSRNHGKLLNYPRMDYTAFWIKLETLRGRLLIMVIKHGAPLSGIFG